jgi:hypothetical protein
MIATGSDPQLAPEEGSQRLAVSFVPDAEA